MFRHVTKIVNECESEKLNKYLLQGGKSMKGFMNLKISAKLLIGFILVAILAGIMGVYSIINIKSLDDSDTELYEHNTVPIAQMADISTAFQRLRVNMRDMIIADDAETIEANRVRIMDRRAEISENSTEFEKLIISDDMQALYDDFKATRVVYGAEIDKVIVLAQANKDDEAILALSEDAPVGVANRAEQDAITAIIEAKISDADKKSISNSAQANSTTMIMIIILVIVMVLSIVLGLVLSSMISKPIKRALTMIQELGKGHLGMRLKMDTKDEVGQMAVAMDNFADSLQNTTVKTVQMIAAGDMTAKLVPFDDKDEITPALQTCIKNVSALVTDANMLSIAAMEGKLDTRADASKHGGDFAKIVEGVNKTLDSVIGPLNVAAEYVDRISKGDIPPKITDKYNGDFNEIKNNLNQCIDAVNSLVADAEKLVQLSDVGQLSARADKSKHGGDFAKIIDCVNRTLDAIVKPVHEAAAVLNEMAAGSLKSRVVGDYKGDHAEIKNALNSTQDALSEYVTEISYVLSEMANSNLDSQITSDYRGDFTPIKDALNLILDSFNQTLSDINTSSDQVAAGSRQVSDGSQALSQGATEQASSIEELTASINDIASQTKKNAMSANEANELAVVASSNAGQGNSQMKDMLKAMEEINQSSSNISKIIKVIDDIAFQTNILALNAAVEAARAGQHGKGFAVVAEEVRTLAARSASAAKEITGMIEGSIQKVNAGTRIANDTAEALNKIVTDVTKVADIVSSIAIASNDQATGIAQINQGVEQVSRVIQTNSATAEEGSAASEELSSQADLLKDMISRFNLRQEGRTARVSGSDSSRRMLTDGSDAGRLAKKKPGSTKPKISLNDKEFGKY